MVHPDYVAAFNGAFNVLNKFNIKTFPVDLDLIINAVPNLRLCSYSEFCIKRLVSVEDAVEWIFESELGIITQHPTKKDRHMVN